MQIINKKDKIFLAGHNGLLGSSILKKLKQFGYKNIITIDTTQKLGTPCIRNMRISVVNILNMLASDMSEKEILEDFPELTKEDILIAIEFAALRLNHTFIAA